jgi:cbb3-type cytochrome oxidase subunit 3
MKKILVFFMVLVLGASMAYGLEYEVVAPCQATLNESFTISTLFKNADGELAVGYELPDGMLRDVAELTGVTTQDAKVDGNTHKWTFKTTNDKTANISMTVFPTKAGEYTFYVYTIIPPGKEQRDERQIIISGSNVPGAVTPIEQPTEEVETDWVLLFQVLVLLGTLYYIFDRHEKDKQEEASQEPEQISADEMDSYQQTEEHSGMYSMR